MFPFHPRTNKFAQGKFSITIKAESPTYLEEWGEEKWVWGWVDQMEGSKNSEGLKPRPFTCVNETHPILLCL